MLNSKALAASASAPKVYIEECFQSWLYTGNGSTQTITNGIDLSGKGGLVWIKSRSNNVNNSLYDTARGATKSLASNTTGSEITRSDTLTSFNSNGFSLGADSFYNFVNNAGFASNNYASWTFRKAAKFFDVVTYTGTGSDQTISHNLGSTPGCIIVKGTNSTSDWYVYHRSLTTATENWIRLNSTGAANGAIGQNLWGPPTDTTFKVDTYLGLSTSGGTYVAYLFAHDAGGFGDSGNESVVKCGSFTTAGGGTLSVNLGWEPQFVIYKRTDSSGIWIMLDTMRGWSQSDDYRLFANTSGAEGAANEGSPTATGFDFTDPVAGYSYIYIAIRRGPMKTPTDATKVFDVKTATQAIDASNQPPSVGFPADFAYYAGRNAATGTFAGSRLTGNQYLQTATTGAAVTSSWAWDTQTGWRAGVSIEGSASWAFGYFRRAPGFFDVVAYTGTGSARTVSHNLAVVPELIITKQRSGSNNWFTYHSGIGATNWVALNLDNASTTSSTVWNDTAPTSSVFTVGTASNNTSSATLIAYLFATCPGVSKVGSYTGTGTTLSVDCGFTNGCRFVLIKRTDSTGDWYVWDTARGIVSGNDPYLLLNSTAAEVTNTDYIDPLSSGFQISSTAPAAINANGGSFIYLAVA